jgi:hypothetical protein
MKLFVRYINPLKCIKREHFLPDFVLSFRRNEEITPRMIMVLVPLDRSMDLIFTVGKDIIVLFIKKHARTNNLHE